jgi:CubicO group peptidase (beta-lactamase class C family)
MKTLKILLNILLGFLALFALLFLALSIVAGPDTAFRIVYYNDTDIDDYKIFPARTLRASDQPFHFKTNADTSRVLATYEGMPLDDFLQTQRTAAFLIIKDDTILSERYFEGYSESTPIQAFSMSKSILSILVGRAVDDGYFTTDQSVTDFVSELAVNGFDRVTIEDLLQMASGSNYRQGGLFYDYNPFSLHPRFEYSPRLEKEITTRLEVIDEPGSEFIYKSGDTALLSLILRRVLKTKTITEYMQETMWTPLGMEYDGFYTVDHAGPNGLEKTWCCLAATARDFAKFGRLMLNHGSWDGVQIISSDWVKTSTQPDPADPRDFSDFAAIPGFQGYQYQWWLAPQDDAYFGDGKLGQLLYVNPKERIIIVRLGRVGDEPVSWLAVFETLMKDVK